MTAVLSGIRVIEVGIWGYVPAAGVALAEWGADVVKIEHPEYGDPMRGAAFNGVVPGAAGSSVLYEVFNRGKRSVGIDLDTDGGHDLLLKLVDGADVFVTNFMESARRRLRIDHDVVMARNPRIVYARASGQGSRGPDADKGGFDFVSYWARTGAGLGAMPGGAGAPATPPSSGFGDIQSGLILAGGIAAALLHRERTGEGVLVDSSLLAAGLWAMQPSLAGVHVSGADDMPRWDHHRPPNPLVNTYRIADGRFVMLSMLDSDRYWPGLCAALGQAELGGDARFATAVSRAEHVTACVAELDRIFAGHDLEHWKARLATQEGPWAIIKTAAEALHDPQATENGYVRWIGYEDGSRLPVAAVPVGFGGPTGIPAPPTAAAPAPRHAAHTDEVLLECGLSWDELLEHKVKGAVS